MSKRGFTLIELMIVVGVILIIAAVAIPSLLRSRVAANEGSIVATLHTITTAQAEFRHAAEVDQDGDGIGEHGFLGELAGNVNLRNWGGARKAVPPYLPSTLRTDANGRASTSGYFVTIYLADGNNGGLSEVGNAGPGGVDANAADDQEIGFVCYAWPLQNKKTGARTFVVTEQTQIYQTNMVATAYDGTNSVPAPNAVYRGNPLVSSLGISPGGAANDGNIWVSAGG